MVEIDWTQVKRLDLPRLGQLGFVVNDVEASMPVYASLYGISTWYQTHFTENIIEVNERRYDADWQIFFGYSGKVQVELIDLGGDKDNIFGQFLDRRGVGLQHLGFNVSNLDDRIATAERLGIEVLQRAALRTDGGFKIRVAYLDTEALCGITLELIEVKMGPFNLATSKWIIELGVLLGDAEKVRV